MYRLAFAICLVNSKHLAKSADKSTPNFCILICRIDALSNSSAGFMLPGERPGETLRGGHWYRHGNRPWHFLNLNLLALARRFGLHPGDTLVTLHLFLVQGHRRHSHTAVEFFVNLFF